MLAAMAQELGQPVRFPLVRPLEPLLLKETDRENNEQLRLCLVTQIKVLSWLLTRFRLGNVHDGAAVAALAGHRHLAHSFSGQSDVC